MTVLLGLLAAIAVGTSDFAGGVAGRRAPVLAITTLSHLGGGLVGIVLAVVISGDATTGDLLWGTVAGVGGAAGLVALYAGYARARVSIAAPVAGVGAAAIPSIADGFSGGDSLTTSSIVGVGLGLVAIALVSIARPENTDEAVGTVAASLAYGFGGAAGLGLLLLGLAQTGDDAGMWPLAAARFAGFAALAVIMLGARQPALVPKPVLPLVAAIAVLNTGGNALFIGASRAGSTTVAAVVTSMFPAVTVIWAWRVFGERIRRLQVAGIALALVAVALIAAG